jgi:hypothetical protein
MLSDWFHFGLPGEYSSLQLARGHYILSEQEGQCEVAYDLQELRTAAEHFRKNDVLQCDAAGGWVFALCEDGAIRGRQKKEAQGKAHGSRSLPKIREPWRPELPLGNFDYQSCAPATSENSYRQ